ncbi:hypothetical protein Q1695_004355 [Nippostrongylus brasiliensis]|nr:hypothetical protein Q1695_004355 [Nippostrongylus brasiliensis]
MKADCYKPVKTLDEAEKETCKTVYEDIGYAALKLVEAFVEVGTDESKTATIKEKLSQKFSNTESPNPSTNFTNEVYALGHEVLDMMKR